MEGKTKIKKRLIILSILILIACIIGLSVIFTENFRATKRAVVVRVNEHSLDVMGVDNEGDLNIVSFGPKGNIGFKQGQEVLIYFNGMVAASYPSQIFSVGKIKILKEESDVTIPENVLKRYYSSRDNVTFSIYEFTKTGLSFTIKDTNELPYEYSNTYVIYKMVKNEEYTGIGYKIGEDTENSTSGYIRSRT